MVNYKDLGLVNTREMFKRAVAGGYAIPAFNFIYFDIMKKKFQLGDTNGLQNRDDGQVPVA